MLGGVTGEHSDWHVAAVTTCVAADGCWERRKLPMPGLLESLTLGTTDNVLFFGSKVRAQLALEFGTTASRTIANSGIISGA